MTALLQEYRRTGRRPTLAEKIEAERDAEALRGMLRRLQRDGELTDEIRELIYRRQQALEARNG